MFDKQKIKDMCVDFSLLEDLEEHITQKTNEYIKIIKNDFKIKNIEFRIDFSSILAKSINKNSHFEIIIGRNLTKSLLGFCELISSNIAEYLKWNKKENLTSFIFYYIYWFILNHEVSHVLFGHLDYISTNGKAYRTPEGITTIILHENNDTNINYWHALESEADGNAMSMTLNSFRLINVSTQWISLSEQEKIKVHAIISTLVYKFMNLLSGNEPDITHPEPFIRQNLTLPCLDVLEKLQGLKPRTYTHMVVQSHLDFSTRFFNIYPSNDEIEKSYSWMKNIDSILREMKIRKSAI